MFLVQIRKEQWVDAHKIETLWIDDQGFLRLTMQGDTESVYFVDKKYSHSFLNHLSVSQENPCCQLPMDQFQPEEDE